MSKVASPVTGKPYGLAAVCRAWRIARSGIYRHRMPMVTKVVHSLRGLRPLESEIRAALDEPSS